MKIISLKPAGIGLLVIFLSFSIYTGAKVCNKNPPKYEIRSTKDSSLFWLEMVKSILSESMQSNPDFSKQSALLDSVISTNPTNRQAVGFKLQILCKENKHDDAQDLLSKQILLQPTEYNYLIWRGALYKIHLNNELATSDFKNAKQIILHLMKTQKDSVLLSSYDIIAKLNILLGENKDSCINRFMNETAFLKSSVTNYNEYKKYLSIFNVEKFIASYGRGGL